MKKNGCRLCEADAKSNADYNSNSIFYQCPICGRYELTIDGISSIDMNHLASYLIYHKYPAILGEPRYYTTLRKALCDQYRAEYDNGQNTRGRPVHLDADIVENWYPKTFSERIDHILLYLSSKGKHLGQAIWLEYAECMSAMFIDRYDYEEESTSTRVVQKERNASEYEDELAYVLDYLKQCEYILPDTSPLGEDGVEIIISPKGYARIDELQKNTSRGRNVLVAMKFGADTVPLREAIKRGIKDAGYVPILIDEVQHNDFITPELLKHIRDSKFVVVELTHQNNGAYFEEGYAMGVGKPIIQICHNPNDLHFDIKQINSITWEIEEDIPEKLKNRILATID